MPEQPISPVDVDRAVRNLTARYCDAVARNDGELFASLWTADAEWIAAGHTTAGRERIARVFTKLRGNYVLCTQELMSGWVEVLDTGAAGAPTSAEARWQIRELQWSADAPVSCVLGIYRDRVVADGGAWRFSQRRFDILYRGPVDLSGMVTPIRAFDD